MDLSTACHGRGQLRSEVHKPSDALGARTSKGSGRAVRCPVQETRACTVCARFLTATGICEDPAAVGAVVEAAVPLAGIAIAIRAQVVDGELVRLLVESYRSRRVVTFSTKVRVRVRVRGIN